MKSKKILGILVGITALFCLSFEFGTDPNEQSFKKMTVEYRDFQGTNKKSYKIEEVVKNESGWITSHNLYDETGNLIDGSYSIVYDNNGNIKEKKNSMYSAAMGKVIHQKITYSNVFEKGGKLKQSLLIDKENPERVDTITYVRDANGILTLKRSRLGDLTKVTMLNKEGKAEKELEKVKGKLYLTRTFDYSVNGIKQIIGVNPEREEIQKYTYEYNEKGKLIKQDRTYKGLDIDFHSIYKYNQKGQLMTEERTDKGTKSVIVYEYLPDGRIDKISVKNEKAIRLNERVYTYE